MYKVHIAGFWERDPKKVSCLSSMKKIVKMCNQAPNADIFIYLMPKADYAGDFINDIIKCCNAQIRIYLYLFENLYFLFETVFGFVTIF